MQNAECRMQNAKCRIQNYFIPLHFTHKEKDLVRSAVVCEANLMSKTRNKFYY